MDDWEKMQMSLDDANLRMAEKKFLEPDDAPDEKLYIVKVTATVDWECEVWANSAEDAEEIAKDEIQYELRKGRLSADVVEAEVVEE